MISSMDIAVASDRAREIRKALESFASAGCEEISAYEYESTIDMLTRLANNAILIRHQAIVARARIAKAKRAFDRDMRKALKS